MMMRKLLDTSMVSFLIHTLHILIIAQCKKGKSAFVSCAAKPTREKSTLTFLPGGKSSQTLLANCHKTRALKHHRPTAASPSAKEPIRFHSLTPVQM